MPLIRIVEDRGFATELDHLNHRSQFIREMASAILPVGEGFESVMSLANRVYERHYPPQAELPNAYRAEIPGRTSLSA